MKIIRNKKKKKLFPNYLNYHPVDIQESAKPHVRLNAIDDQQVHRLQFCVTIEAYLLRHYVTSVHGHRQVQSYFLFDAKLISPLGEYLNAIHRGLAADSTQI